MDYISAKMAAEKWGISPVLVRKHCRDHRIPGAVFREGVWLIPEEAERPKPSVNTWIHPEVPPLAAKLVRQKTKKGHHDLYDFVQIELTYASCRLASNRLTRDQVETIFRKGKVRESFEPMKVSDLVEAMNHCVCVNYILDHVGRPLSQRMILHLHYMLMFGTVDQRRQRVTPGTYRTKGVRRKDRTLIPAETIGEKLKTLIEDYEAQEEIGRTEILDFHVRFERIMPFEDGNGRVGRLILFKECLRHDVMPFIIGDKCRSEYLEGIKKWDKDRMVLLQAVAAAQERFERAVRMCKLGEYRLPEFMNQYDEEDEDNE